MSVLPGVQHERQAFAKSADALAAVAAFVEATTVGWGLPELVASLQFAARELVAWNVANGPAGEFTVTLTYDKPVVHIEVADRGALVPNPYVSCVDADLAVRLLANPAIEWGAELDSRGRTLWVSFSAQQCAEGTAA